MRPDEASVRGWFNPSDAGLDIFVLFSVGANPIRTSKGLKNSMKFQVWLSITLSMSVPLRVPVVVTARCAVVRSMVSALRVRSFISG